MDTVRASQLIYTNVEAAVSPRGRAGFQILFSTRQELDERDEAEAASRLFYRPRPGGPEPVKHVFYPTKSGCVALAQIVSLPEPDAVGRRGRFLAHALFLEAEQFARFDNNPFALIRQFTFYTTVEQAFAVGERDTGNIAAANVDLSALTSVESESRMTEQGTEAQLRQRRALMLLSHQRAIGLDTRNALGFFGQPKAVYNHIENLLLQTPIPLRGQCSFDTFFVNGDLNQTPYWAVGLPPGERAHARLFCFNAEDGEFLNRMEVAPASTYERWLEHNSASSHSPSFSFLSNDAYRMGQWLDRSEDNVPADTVGKIDEGVFRDLMQLSGQVVERRLRDRLTDQVASLSNYIAPMAQEWALSQRSAIFGICEQGFPNEMLSKWLHQFCTGRITPLTAGEVRDLAVFADRSGDRWLSWVTLRWTQQWDRLGEELQSAGEDEFQHFTRWALQTISFQIEWTARHTNDSLLFGPSIKMDETCADDAKPLLLALLGVCLDSSETGKLFGIELRRPSFRGRSTTSAMGLDGTGLSQHVNKTRWLWLMNHLNQQGS